MLKFKYAYWLPLILLAGCATPPATAPTIATFQASAAKVCRVLQPVANGVQTSLAELTTPLNSNDTANITKVVDDVNAFCNATETVTASNLQTLVDAAFPVLVSVIQKSALTANGKTASILLLNATQTTIEILVPSITPSNSVPVSNVK